MWCERGWSFGLNPGKMKEMEQNSSHFASDSTYRTKKDENRKDPFDLEVWSVGTLGRSLQNGKTSDEPPGICQTSGFPCPPLLPPFHGYLGVT